MVPCSSFVCWFESCLGAFTDNLLPAASSTEPFGLHIAEATKVLTINYQLSIHSLRIGGQTYIRHSHLFLSRLKDFLLITILL